MVLAPLQGLGPITVTPGALTPFPTPFTVPVIESSFCSLSLFCFFFVFSDHVFFPFALVTSPQRFCQFSMHGPDSRADLQDPVGFGSLLTSVTVGVLANSPLPATGMFQVVGG